jgi:hypothetical protein
MVRIGRESGMQSCFFIPRLFSENS